MKNQNTTNQTTQETINQTAEKVDGMTKSKGQTAAKNHANAKPKNKDANKPSKTKGEKNMKETKKNSQNQKEQNNKTFWTNKDKREVNLVRVAPKTTVTAVNNELVYVSSAEVSGKVVVFPKTIKDGQLDNFARLVMGKTFDIARDRIMSKTASIDRKIQNRDEPETPEETAQKKANEMTLESITKLRRTYKTGGAGTVADSLALLLACDIMGENLPIDLTRFKTTLARVYKSFHEFVVMGATDGKATMSEEDMNNIAEFRTTLCDTMSVFCKDTAWNNEFKLSVSAKDAVYFYELSFLREENGEPVFIWDTKGKDNKELKELHKALIHWLYRKMKIELGK